VSRPRRSRRRCAAFDGEWNGPVADRSRRGFSSPHRDVGADVKIVVSSSGNGTEFRDIAKQRTTQLYLY
jgi:hypothetical protein